MWGDVAIAFLLAFIVTFMATPYTIKIAHKVGAVDCETLDDTTILQIKDIAMSQLQCGFEDVSIIQSNNK